MKTIRHLFLIASIIWVAQQSSSAELLSYWNFNNNNPAYNSGAGLVGSFRTSGTTYGEAYTTTSGSTAGTLASNTSNSTVFNGAGIYIDFANMATINSGTNVTLNGKKWSDHSSQESTGGPAGYGVFSDSTVNRAGTDSTTGGSLIFLNPGTALNGKYITFSLSSVGYDTLSLTYATRLSVAMPSGSQIWTYSTDGTNFSSLATLNPTRNSAFNAQTLDLSALSSSALNNQSAFYLRLAFNSAGGVGSYSLDNIQLTGLAIPEPATWIMVLASGSGLILMRRHRARLA